MEFEKECHDNLKRSEEMLDEMDEHKQNISHIFPKNFIEIP